MATPPQPVHLLRFGVFEMNLTTGELRKNGTKIRLQEQPFTILTVLAMRSGELVSREELYAKLPKHGTYDAKGGLNNAIQKIREALDDSANTPRFIQTIPNRGYRFLVPVKFIPKGSFDCNAGLSLDGDSFQKEVSQIHQELLSTSSEHVLTALLHRVNGLINRQPEHPALYEAQMLQGKIEAAVDHCASSEQNRMNHGVSFETAAEVFEDPQALSLNGHGSVWYTLGRAWRQFGPLRRPVLLMVSHHASVGQNGQEEICITAARKATQAERRAYEKASKKKRQ